MPALTISQTAEQIRVAFEQYIEATYHIGHPMLIRQRRRLLQDEGVIYQAPYIESTPRYATGNRFGDLDVPLVVKKLFTKLGEGDDRLLWDPPYTHQADALEQAAGRRKSLAITTGTGSGKTESFLMPMLAHLAEEAATDPESFGTPAVRALILYPMNALVNDQLGRLRALLGDARVAGQFEQWAGRPARFARYTSRTLYPGVRSAARDQVRLKPIERFYLDLADKASGTPSERRDNAERLIKTLREKGKWPAKPDLRAWYGEPGERWERDGEPARAITQPHDVELLTRHEVLAAPPDILITNYSMLEYMLMRPLERPIFDKTKSWLAAHPDQQFLLIVDEAHLYRGAAGAEVALLLRRFRTRLGIDPSRLQVICTSASFTSPEYACRFAAQLSGKDVEDFVAVTDQKAERPHASVGSLADAETLAAVDMLAFHAAEDDSTRSETVRPLLDHLGVVPEPGESAGQVLYRALQDFGPMSLLVNQTMGTAKPVASLGSVIFPDADEALADAATSNLINLGSFARKNDDDAGLLPSRVHTFFRGLPGLWACMDPDCTELPDDERNMGPIGKLYAQPRSTCACGARVFELYTCRNCGTAYARTYTDNATDPTYLWAEGGTAFDSVSGTAHTLKPLDLLLEPPDADVPAKQLAPQKKELDLITGALDACVGNRYRVVYLPGQRDGEEIEDEDGETSHANGEFKPCGVCHQTAAFGRSYVQDHQTKGDQPFQALVTRQLEVQPPGHQVRSSFAPLQGRKVLAFSDSRQVAARLAPNLVEYSLRDVIRPLLIRGWNEMAALMPSANMDAAYLAVMIGAKRLAVRLRPETKTDESLAIVEEVAELLDSWDQDHDPQRIDELSGIREPAPESLLRSIFATLTDRFYGLTALGLASLREAPTHRITTTLAGLSDLPGIADTPETKLALVRMWLDQWASQRSIRFSDTPGSWLHTSGGVKTISGDFGRLRSWFGNAAVHRKFSKEWLPVLRQTFCRSDGQQFVLLAAKVALDTKASWAYCPRCRTTQRPFPGIRRCVACQSDQLAPIDPMTDVVFRARKGYYRASTEKALASTRSDPIMSIVAAEHTAQLNEAQAGEVFSKAEENELLFQDIQLLDNRPAIDVLSCTTTMEVGIDIGNLSGVALRNMPPSRANYQQRSGRAGRRGNAVASVVAFGSSDTHDDHYFRHPADMISGRVVDPVLTMDNPDIARRHITAFLLQRYHLDRVSGNPAERSTQLFEVLGTVEQFLGDQAALNRADFEAWLRENEEPLSREVVAWLPVELRDNDRASLIDGLVSGTLSAIDDALRGDSDEADLDAAEEPDRDAVKDVPEEDGADVPSPRRRQAFLLDRLLYEGILPRYAFPTDVASFYVFDEANYKRYHPAFRYAPSQALTVALSQYAPDKTVWIDNLKWTSGAIYSQMERERKDAWEKHKVYFECSVCHYAETKELVEAQKGQMLECPACKSADSFGSGSRKGKSMSWMRPPGFAHRATDEPGVSAEDSPEPSYATRAKLVGLQLVKESDWMAIKERIKQTAGRYRLLVTNTGPRGEGYDYCTKCGLIEASASTSHILDGAHSKPYPDKDEPVCPAPLRVTRGIALGTDFISDVLLIRIRVDKDVSLDPHYLSTQVALRTVAEAITVAAADRLDIDATEIQAEFRPVVTLGSGEGREAEIYLYDTLPGGAGFTRRIHELGVELYELALKRLEECPSDCDESCYRCLRSYRNKFDHRFLDRKVGAALLRHLLYGTPPILDEERRRRSTEKLAVALEGMELHGTSFTLDAVVDVPGIGSVPVPLLAEKDGRRTGFYVCSPMMQSGAPTQLLQDAGDLSAFPVRPINDIFVTKNLPQACSQVREVIG